MQEPLCDRDRHLFSPGRKRILSLDGGGVRGALSIAYLERLEALLAEHYGKPVRLCDWFDLIAGTSTGAIIAAALAFGMSAMDIKTFYLQMAPKIFRRSLWRLPGWTAKFDAKILQAELSAVFGDRRLDTEDLHTGLCVVLKRMDTGGSWILLNNPKSRYWTTPPDQSFIGNSAFRLAQLVRASAAAPHYFDPETIEIVEGQPPGLFLDGAMTPHNNPALIAFLASHLPSFGLNWPTGPDKLTIVSIGTGSYRPTLTIAQAKRSHAIGLAVTSLGALIAENQRLSLLILSWLGQTSIPWSLDTEIGDLVGVAPNFGKLFIFNRLDVELQQQWLAEHLGLDLTIAAVDRLRRLDEPSNVGELYAMGEKAARIQLQLGQVAVW